MVEDLFCPDLAIPAQAVMIMEADQIVDRLGRMEGTCVIGKMFGQILITGGKKEQKLAVLCRSEHDFRQMQRL